jgi:predicted transcriptional regulator
MNTMQSTDIREAAHQLIDQLDHPTWAELAYQATVKASIEQGLEEARAGKLIAQEDIEKEFGVSR